MTIRRNLSILTEVELMKLHHINTSHSNLFLAHNTTLEKKKLVLLSTLELGDSVFLHGK